MSYRMSQAEREHFLAEVRVGVLSVAEEGRAPLTVPIWYGYAPGGEVAVWMGKTSRKAALLQRAGRFSLCVQNEQTPYRYVSVEGPIVTVEPVDLERDARPIARRYLGVEAGDQYVVGVAEAIASGQDVVFRMRPERWLTADYSKAGDDS
ncbi:MAG TPA: pyridoxamine 5'-phosphate oxidase family protein [Roseiflexaceae bacterium]|nr:pyridoxamine 5'-phosphate oxidase family protein [Roseiflexaceae bacterium]